MKATFKNVCIALSLLVAVTATLIAVDKSDDISVSAPKTCVKVTVVDLENKPVHNAKVTVEGKSFFTDNKGLSPVIEQESPINSYDASVTDWYTVTVTVIADGYVPSVAFNCVVYSGQTRKITVKAYPVDASDLPYVSYVESPPAEYVQTLFNG